MSPRITSRTRSGNKRGSLQSRLRLRLRPVRRLLPYRLQFVLALFCLSSMPVLWSLWRLLVVPPLLLLMLLLSL